MSNTFQNEIESFFSTSTILQEFNSCNLFFVRHDGIILYSTDKNSSDLEQSSIGALLGGVWQAAEALTSFLPNNHDEVFRFSFDTSSKGIYILPVEFDGKKYYLSVTYFEQINPGYLKTLIRKLAQKLKLYLRELNHRLRESHDSKFLFKDITDDEMDNLFTFAGN